MSDHWINLQKAVDRRESADYRNKRQELQQREIGLMRQREQVAKMRRDLPTGAVIKQHYTLMKVPLTGPLAINLSAKCAYRNYSPPKWSLCCTI